MHRLQTMSVLKLASVAVATGFNAPTNRVRIKACELVTPTFALFSGDRQTIHTSPNVSAVANFAVKESIFTRSYNFLHFHAFKKYIYKGKGYILYRNVIGSLDHVKFMNDLKMPDTFYSWFLVTELHVWMLMTRLMAGGKDGSEVRNYLVEAMWQDIDVRRKKLGAVRLTTVKSNIEEIGFQFNAAIINYDEGIMNNDVVLAGALWRRILQSECNDPVQLERLLIYVRKTMNMLDKLPTDALTNLCKVQWINYNDC